MVAAGVFTTLPVTCPERNSTGTTTHVTTAHAVTTVAAVTHVVLRRAHHAWVAVSTTVASILHRVTTGRALLHRRERAAETSGATLEVGEAARRAVPVARAGTVLARWERVQDVSGTVKNAGGRRRDLDGLFVKCAPVHAQALGGLYLLAYIDTTFRVQHTSSWDEKIAKPVPVGLC
jgi:hypothetical protein